VAEKLGIDVVVMPADASMLSAIGLGHAVVERFAQQQVLRPLAEVHKDLASLIDDLSSQARRAIVSEGVAEQRVVVRRQIVNLRLLGQESSIAVELDEVSEIERAFVEKYRAIYGHVPQGKPIEVESIRVVASSMPDEADECRSSPTAFEARPTSELRAWFDGSWRHVHVYERDELLPGAHLAGPALVFESRSAYVIESGWRCEIDAAAAIIARRSAESEPSSNRSDSAVVREALFANRFTSIAKQMGQMLQRTAVSTNVKERLDYSCALLDADGYLVVHAPHMPVHLGALGLCVRALREALPMQSPGVRWFASA
jgi:5-oxoprolinase (ATP-hydrolysing)